jgi:hypothetical protein
MKTRSQGNLHPFPGNYSLVTIPDCLREWNPAFGEKVTVGVVRRTMFCDFYARAVVAGQDPRAKSAVARRFLALATAPPVRAAAGSSGGVAPATDRPPMITYSTLEKTGMRLLRAPRLDRPPQHI